MQFLPSVPTVPRAKESSRHPVEVEKASASLVGTASSRLRSSAAERLALNQGAAGSSPAGDTSFIRV